MTIPTRTPQIGQDRVRVDGPLKVTGTAPYAYEQKVENPAYLFPLVSAIALGKVLRMDVRAAEALPGVLKVMTHENAPRLRIKTDPELYILQSAEVQYKGQYIGAVLAESPEVARHAASLVRVDYEQKAHDAHFTPEHPQKVAPKRINGSKPSATQEGDVDAAIAAAPHTLDAVYTTPNEHHNPLEPHPIIAIWHGDAGLSPNAKRLTLHDSNQGPAFTMLLLPPLLGILPTQLEVFSPYVGGSFGTKGSPHSHIVLAALAARMLPGRPVKYNMTRQQMFRTTGFRPESHQRVRLAADAQGHLSAIVHEATAPTARLKQFVEQTATPARMLYAAPNRKTAHFVVPLDIAPATFMRAPGEFTGMFALETAMDELAETCGLDPIEFRIINEPSVDPENGKAWSTRNLVVCLREGAKLFGWKQRQAPGQRSEGEWQYGLGVASTTYPDQHLLNTFARVRFEGGRYKVELQAADIGTGAWTILGQIAADALSVDVNLIDVEIGRSDLPFAMVAGGSMGTYTWGSSIMVAAIKFREKYGLNPPEGAAVRAAGQRPKDFKNYSRHSFGAHFAEVKASRVTGEVRVTRMLGIYAAGKIINPRTANSQLIGGMTMGISAALHEESYLDSRFGHVVNQDFAGYHIAAHADIPDIQARWIEEFDPYFGPTGAKGIGEVGIVSVPAAIGNAIYNATGKRLRDLPFTPGKLLN
ncbi:xanthine dehydrogenase family protein molybdopterin-binding subunit [Deinococcus sp.]|uniref:xanthine dehydrogenase family protein molybdopterin-binding subunit n=1 Tax=Deinococcus sp. TaxID=47478 RepID=UPI0025C43016|nr:xanthine dehydrogenase family protein molybdopterin-binding subunit [Deinococcus sp.]